MVSPSGSPAGQVKPGYSVGTNLPLSLLRLLQGCSGVVLSDECSSHEQDGPDATADLLNVRKGHAEYLDRGSAVDAGRRFCSRAGRRGERQSDRAPLPCGRPGAESCHDTHCGTPQDPPSRFPGTSGH